MKNEQLILAKKTSKEGQKWYLLENADQHLIK